MSCPVDDDFVLGLAAALAAALDLAFPHVDARRLWKTGFLSLALKVTQASFALRCYLGPDQSQADLHVLTLAASALASLDARDDIITVMPVELARLEFAADHVSFRQQVRKWAGHQWRCCLGALCADIRKVLLERSVDKHSSSTPLPCDNFFWHGPESWKTYLSWASAFCSRQTLSKTVSKTLADRHEKEL